jgi:hypothetical protein
MFKTFIFIFLCCQDAKQFYLGLPHHACQEAQSTSGSQGGGQIHPGHSRSPLNNNNNNGGGKQGGPPTYYSTTSAMFPPPPPAPMARPVTIIRSTGKIN